MVCFLENASALIGVDDISCYNRKKKRPMNEQKRRDYIKKERMANQFAMDILIPKKLILLALEHVKKTEPPSQTHAAKDAPDFNRGRNWRTTWGK